MTDEVETVARALCASNQDIWTNGPADWAYLDDARAAIAALDKARGKRLLRLFEDHYWDSFQNNKQLILAHVKSVLEMAAAPSPETEA